MEPNIPVQAFVERYLSEARYFLKSRSIYSALRILGRFYGHRPLDSLDTTDIYAYIQFRQENGVGHRTINQDLAMFKVAINYARQNWKLRIDNPVVYRRLKTLPYRLRYLSKHEAKELIQAADTYKVRLANFIRLALNTGCRKTELLTLEWRDVDLQRKFILLRPENTKTNKFRAIPLNDIAISALSRQKSDNDTPWVFRNVHGNRLCRIDCDFRRVIRRLNLTDFHIHDLRHTFASWLVSEGVELIKVRDLLGHTSIKMTERYAHIMPERLRDAVNVLDLFQRDVQ